MGDFMVFSGIGGSRGNTDANIKKIILRCKCFAIFFFLSSKAAKYAEIMSNGKLQMHP
jgi:hypothetical protein